ncbi:MAG: GumC family protein, partial [Terriglobia bacterium]
MYTARSTIMIERQTPEVLDIRQPFAEDEADYTDPDNFYRTQDDILESRSLASRVIVALDLQHNRFFDSEITSRGKRHSTSGAAQGAEGSGDRKVQGPGKSNDAATVTPDTLETYLNNLEIRPKQGTRLVTVEFTSPDPALSARIVNAHIQAYIARGIELRSQASASAVRFLKSRLANLKTNVEQAEAALNKYRRQRGIIAESPNDKATLIIERLSELTKELTDVQAERIDLEAKVHLLTATDYRSLPEVLNQPTVQVLSEELATVDSQYASLASEYKPGYPPLEDLAAKKRKLEGRLNDEMRRIATSINLKYKTAVAREQDLRDEIELEKKNALALNDASLQDSILSRAVDSNRELYKHVLARVNELGMAAAMSDSNVSIVDYAQPPQRHSSPKKPFDLAFAGILGLFLGVVMSFAIEHFDDAIRGPDEVQSVLGLPSLGLVPNFTELSGPGRRVSKYLPGGRVRALEKTEPPRNHELVAGLESLPSAIEAYRAVRLGLMFSRAEKPPTTILVTSACAKEGKTVTAINTGIAFAEMGERVLLLDADLRRPRCHQALGVPNQQGLAEILTGQAAFEHIVRPTHIAGLSCVPAGSSTPNPAALFASKATAALLNCLRRCYDCVLIDSAPILSVTDSLLLAGLVDGVLVVAGPETSRQDVQRACAMLAQARANIFGVVLNRYPTRSSYYRDYYHYFGAPEYSRS